MNVLFFIAMAIILGLVGGKLVQRLRLPAVVGYLIAGLAFGPSVLRVFTPELLKQLDVFTAFALSLVAFIIGSEMKISTLRDMGKGIGVITLLESFGAFLLVTAGVYLLTRKLYLALVFGAMAPASAPAGTVAVLQECKARGRLTNLLYAVVGLDDGLAIMIFAVAVALAKLLLTGGAISAAAIVEGPILEIVGAIVLGCMVGFATGYVVQRLSGEPNILAVSLAGILLCTGIANFLHFSLILANLSLGMTFVNVFSAANQKAYKAVESISLPAYVIFFFTAGARLEIALLPSMGLLGLVYVVCRIGGLTGGAFVGASLSKQSPVVRKYLGLGILSQAGVAIGLSILAAGEFAGLGEAGTALSVAVVNTIAATTILFEVIGPIGTRFAIARAGEAGANITEEDLMETYRVSNVMDSDTPAIPTGMPLCEVIGLVSNTSSFYYSVVDEKNRVVGAITLDGIRNTFATQELNDWLVALDVVEPLVATVTPEMALSEAIEKARELDAEQLPVVTAEDGNQYVGILDTRSIRRRLSAEVLSKQKEADNMHRITGA